MRTRLKINPRHGNPYIAEGVFNQRGLNAEERAGLHYAIQLKYADGWQDFATFSRLSDAIREWRSNRNGPWRSRFIFRVGKLQCRAPASVLAR